MLAITDSRQAQTLKELCLKTAKKQKFKAGAAGLQNWLPLTILQAVWVWKNRHIDFLSILKLIQTTKILHILSANESTIIHWCKRPDLQVVVFVFWPDVLAFETDPAWNNRCNPHCFRSPLSRLARLSYSQQADWFSVLQLLQMCSNTAKWSQSEGFQHCSWGPFQVRRHWFSLGISCKLFMSITGSYLPFHCLEPAVFPWADYDVPA